MTMHMLHADIRLHTYRGNHRARAREVLARDASPILAQDVVAERAYRHPHGSECRGLGLHRHVMAIPGRNTADRALLEAS